MKIEGITPEELKKHKDTIKIYLTGDEIVALMRGFAVGSASGFYGVDLTIFHQPGLKK